MNFPCNKNLEIGNEYTQINLDKGGYTEPLFRDALETIRATGNERTHTKYRHVATEEEYQKILNKPRKSHTSVSLRSEYIDIAFDNISHYA